MIFSLPDHISIFSQSHLCECTRELDKRGNNGGVVGPVSKQQRDVFRASLFWVRFFWRYPTYQPILFLALAGNHTHSQRH
jgi:hypothetical protein